MLAGPLFLALSAARVDVALKAAGITARGAVRASGRRAGR